MTASERKQKAIQILKQMDIYKPYIKAFEKENQVTYFERYAGFWANQEPDLIAKIKKIEQDYNMIVYAATHEYYEFGECYTLLIVTNYKNEWSNLVVSNENTHRAFAYVWNIDDDSCSEFGSVLVESRYGGLKRIA